MNVAATLREVGAALHAIGDAAIRLADLQEELETATARSALTVSEVADLLSVSSDTVYRRIKDGELPSFLFSGQRRVPYSAVERLMAGRAS